MDVQKVENIPYKQFMEDFCNPGIPVVLKHASKVWKANGLFSPEYFRTHFPDRKTVVNGQEFTMKKLLDLIESSTVENPAPYPIKFDIPSLLPEIEPLISPLGMNYASPNWFQSKVFPSSIIGSSTELFLGSPGGKFPVAHIDYYHTNAWITQLYGDKDFIFFPRGQDEFLYPKINNPWESDVNIFNPDYEKHPKYKYATPIRVTIKQGETIFMPRGIWHTAESITPSISVIFDQINRVNYDLWLKDVWQEKKKKNMLKALAILVYCKIAKYFCLLEDLFTSPRS
jgi:histone arginine demethylase JMJD6